MIPRDYVVPWLVSNAVALALLAVAIVWPRVARFAFALIFLAAGPFNMYTVLTDPGAYLTYGDTAVLPFLRDFIYGVFSQYTAAFVLPVAVAQFALGCLLAIGRRIPLALGALGAIVFFIGIAPLGIGSAFPFSATAIAAVVVMVVKLSRRQEHALNAL